MDENYICVYVILELKKKKKLRTFSSCDGKKKKNTYINVIIGKKINK